MKPGIPSLPRSLSDPRLSILSPIFTITGPLPRCAKTGKAKSLLTRVVFTWITSLFTLRSHDKPNLKSCFKFQ